MRAFLIILALVAAILAGICALLGAMQLVEAPVTHALEAAFPWLAWIAISIIALMALFTAIRSVWKHVAQVFGTSIAARLLSFGVIALVFSDTVRSVVYPFARFVIHLALLVPAFVHEVPAAAASAENDATARPVEKGFESFAALFGQPFERFGHGLLDIDYAWVFVAIAAWAVVGQLISSAMIATAGDSDSSWLQFVKRIRSAPTKTWQHVVLVAVIAMGGLLSVSALITLPLLSQANPLSEDEVSRIEKDFDSIVKIDDKSSLAQDLTLSDSLQKDLNAIGQRVVAERARQQARATQAMTTSPQSSAEPPALTQANDTSSQAPVTTSAAPIPVYSRPQSTPDEALRQLTSIDDQRESIVRESRSAWNDYQTAIKRTIDGSRTTALLAVRRQNYAPGGAGSAYLAQISSWLNDTVSAAKSSADYCRSDLQRGIEMYIDNAKLQLDALENDFFVGSFSTLRSWRAFECTPGVAYRDQPAERPLTLGAFGFSEWLIKLDSLPLTLIAGMLGFGLVGAAVSSVIRRRGERDAESPVFGDITGILVRGLSATIVVYLAVKGGLVIFTAGSAGEPDPHVLLLTCLVASVFSEDVWAAARERFLSKVRENQEQRDSDHAKSSSQNPEADPKPVEPAG